MLFALSALLIATLLSNATAQANTPGSVELTLNGIGNVIVQRGEMLFV
jgi:hypothetical protein